jgi:hypothetical protein
VLKDTVFLVVSDPRGANGGHETTIGEFVWDNLLSSSGRALPPVGPKVAPRGSRRPTGGRVRR